jgi:hypothetical protein
LGEQRALIDAQQYRLAVATGDAIVALTEEGWSVRDISRAVKVTPGRVSQVANVRRRDLVQGA